MQLKTVFVLCLVATAVLAKGGMDAGEDEYKDVEVHREGDQPLSGLKNPCNVHKCKRGEICKLNDAKEAVCECQTCEDEDESVIKVCSTHNVTYGSECELDRDHCLCKNRLEGCSDDEQDKIRLDYFAACKKLTKCPDDELSFFPQRMRDWLFRIMRAVAQESYNEEYRAMLDEARNDEYHAAAVVWKFCDLDADPEDKIVTRRELMYIISSVKPMEHCLVRFLNGCDTNGDNAITLEEWGTCLGLDHEAIQDRCKVIHANQG